MIITEFKKLQVETTDRISDEDVRLRIEDTDSITGICNLIYLDEEQTGKLISCLQQAKRRLEAKKARMNELLEKTDFTELYNRFEKKYNPYPVQMSRAEAFGCALHDGLIDRDTYDAAWRYYKRLWYYVGD